MQARNPSIILTGIIYFLAITCISLYTIHAVMKDAPDYFEGLSVISFAAIFLLLALKTNPNEEPSKSIIPFWIMIIVGILCSIAWINSFFIISQPEIFDYTMLGVLLFGIALIIAGIRGLKAYISEG